MTFAPRCRILAVVCALACASPVARAQAACSSDGRPAPRAVVERFMADTCEGCWRSRPAPVGDALALDWIVPGVDAAAPLSVAALGDASQRLAALARPAPLPQDTVRRTVDRPLNGSLRVARGPAVHDYLGVSIRWKPARPAVGRLTGYLVLVEDLPAGTEGSPIARRLVRNSLVVDGLARQGAGWSEYRAMRIPAGADPGRLEVVGWVEDSGHRLLAASASHCGR